MTANLFSIEECDIATLENENGCTAGWVNVGCHSLRIELTGGNLLVEAYARQNEGVTPLARLSVSDEQVLSAGGVDPETEMPDEDESEGENEPLRHDAD